MAIPIYFNTLFVRRTSIEEKYPGGLKGVEKDFHAPGMSFLRDDHLLAWFSMGGTDHVEVLLEKHGLVHERDGRAEDMAHADLVAGIATNCDWLESKEMPDQYLACWLKGWSPGYLVDFKPRDFQQLASNTACPACDTKLGAGAACQAIDARERTAGPLGSAWGEKTDRDARYLVTCEECNAELTFDAGGCLLAEN